MSTGPAGQLCGEAVGNKSDEVGKSQPNPKIWAPKPKQQAVKGSGMLCWFV